MSMKLASDARRARQLRELSFAKWNETMAQAYGIDELDRLSADDFTRAYVGSDRPVVVRGALKDCAAVSEWTFDHLRRDAGDFLAPVKEWTKAGIRVKHMPLRDYLDSLERYEARRLAGEDDGVRPAYLHDIPLKSVLFDADADLAPFPKDFFPSWYGGDWIKFAQMFLGPSTSLTPLHFDCLLTHNLFFQISGRKRFILLPHRELRRCYPHNWRWCGVDVESPDYDRYPLYRDARAAEVVVGPGDLLYMPPGTLHHVRSLDCALSFNVDWHTKESALKGILAVTRGMPLKNVYYNALIALGLCAGVPSRRLFRFYKSYLSYVS